MPAKEEEKRGRVILAQELHGKTSLVTHLGGTASIPDMAVYFRITCDPFPREEGAEHHETSTPDDEQEGSFAPPAAQRSAGLYSAA